MTVILVMAVVSEGRTRRRQTNLDTEHAHYIGKTTLGQII